MLESRSRTKFENPSIKKVKDEKERKKIISISMGTCGLACGSSEVADAFHRGIRGYEDQISIRMTGCHGFCAAEPNVIIFPDEIFYKNLTVKDADRVIRSIIENEIVEDLLFSENGEKFIHMNEIPFYKYQMRNLLGDNPLINPSIIEDYIKIGGYKALIKALKMGPEEVIEIVKDSGLRGRGGAGFPTGRKWEIARKEKSDRKFVICNADEGDPGAYMDRSLLEGNPHSIIEGIIIGAYAIGASKGIIYVRDEYPLAVQNLTVSLELARKRGVLGEDVFESGFNFDIDIVRGAGAFVCGEETALIYSIENKRGVPRDRPPYPAQAGLFGRPTNINNVETWANVPKILELGAEWFSNIGTESSKGTKIFSLVGKVKNTGLVEVPMGITIKEIVYNIGGGSPTGKSIKAIQTGGPSGGCIPAKLFDLSISYESLIQAGSIMGSGGMIVMDEDTCIVDFAKYFTNFLQYESCGKCVPCREGTQRMHEILTDITEGKATRGSLELLEELGYVIKDISVCGLGQTAPNPVLSTIRYFKNEYLLHIEEGKCPAGVCKALIQYMIIQENCIGCGLCKKNCPVNAIEGELKEPHIINHENCIKCGICRDICKSNAIIFKGGVLK